VLTVEEAGELLRIGRTLAYELRRAGQIPTVRLGGRLLRVPRDELLARLERGDLKPEVRS
jgi:excisionase family DNA binding protein